MRAVTGSVDRVRAAGIWEDIDRRYRAAQESQASSTIDTQAQALLDKETGVEFVLQVAAKLQSKPNNNGSHEYAGERNARTGQPRSLDPPPFNPFLPYDEALWVRHLSPTHTLLLNKFNVLPRHVLVVTREFRPQGMALEAADFEAVWQVLLAAPEPGAAGRSSSRPGGAPDAAFAAYERLCAVAGVFGAREEEPRGQPTIAIDYNLLCTRDYLQLIPRSWEKVDDFACNALGFAGTFLARSEETLAFIRRRTPSGVLVAVGFPWTDDRV
ncbi:hypothetical protein QBZ16_002185 [Prototheca wickerhamii]|uniref:Uncharacterized protein n=1 Tax=Prototheca wickerhamii TaxID=3111 RepID=A0AAD9IN22_PROWI|nr:hypothetical protein QBZ16_002185 [Prototheca wickerhamii]